MTEIDTLPAVRPAVAAEVLLSVQGMTTRFASARGEFDAVSEVSFDIRRGETVAVVGESGSGKSVTCLSMLQLVDLPGRIVAGRALFRQRNGEVVDLLGLPERSLRSIRGNELAMIFQEPMTSLNPVLSIGEQIGEVVRLHQHKSRKAAEAVARTMLERVGISDPAQRLRQYPHELSGGMRQRVMIAMALSCEPSLLIADEATTALDVTIQAQILDLIAGLQRGSGGMSVLFVTHNMGVVAEIADRVVVMYAARVVEEGPVREVFKSPRHPYTRGLLDSIPRIERNAEGSTARRRMTPIPGTVPSPLARPSGCVFATRCSHVRDVCRTAEPPVESVTPDRKVRCVRWREIEP